MPTVSVVILNWNGKSFLSRCLTSLHRVTYKPLEVILVDNHSSDGSTSFVKKKFPWVKLIENKENLGFAGGNNIGFRAARGTYIFFLNNDTEVTSDFLEPLVARMESDKTIGCLQPQIRLLDKRSVMDQVGSYLTSTGYLYHFGFYKPFANALYQEPRSMFCAKGAAMLIPRPVFRTVGGFDDDYYIFFEETDLCHRIWLAGFTVAYEPASVIYHKTGGDTASTYAYAQRVYLSVRNMLVTYLKNFGMQNVLTILPVTGAVHGVLVLIFLLRRRFDLVFAVVRAYWWNVLNIRSTMKKRGRVQSFRSISDTVLNRHTLWNPRISYYYYLLTHLQKYEDSPR